MAESRDRCVGAEHLGSHLCRGRLTRPSCLSSAASFGSSTATNCARRGRTPKTKVPGDEVDRLGQEGTTEVEGSRLLNEKTPPQQSFRGMGGTGLEPVTPSLSSYFGGEDSRPTNDYYRHHPCGFAASDGTPTRMAT
jgi:hypothetical protein